MTGRSIPSVLVHGDLGTWNLLAHHGEVRVLDWESAGWVRAYSEAVGLDLDLVAPLFHTCWMHRAVKESTRLPPGAVGQHGPLRMQLAEAHEAPGIPALAGTARMA